MTKLVSLSIQGAASGHIFQPWQADWTRLGMPDWDRAGLSGHAYLIRVQEV